MKEGLKYILFFKFDITLCLTIFEVYLYADLVPLWSVKLGINFAVMCYSSECSLQELES